jgi:GH24 family phage-related lysozyme (muramidase)
MFGFFKKKDPFMEKLFEHLKDREGFKQSVYLDTLGKATCGIGHLLTKDEKEKYPVKCLVPNDVIDEWFKQDVDTALNAGRRDAKIFCTDNDDVIIGLVSVNYQLGASWSRKFPKTWKHLAHREYDEAIQEVLYKNPPDKEPSNWIEQTPVRVKDFIKTIELLKEIHNGKS